MTLAIIASLVLAADAGTPDSWVLSSKLGKGAEREAVIKEWMAKSSDPAEKPLTREEAEKLLDDPRAQLIYGEKTISIVAPSMQLRQRQQHIDLLKLFLQPERIAAGAEFYVLHRKQLE